MLQSGVLVSRSSNSRGAGNRRIGYPLHGNVVLGESFFDTVIAARLVQVRFRRNTILKI